MLNVSHETTELKTRGSSSRRESIDAENCRMERWLSDKIEASKKSPSVEIVALTPVLAKLLLKRNEDNRPLSEVNLERLKRDMNEGRWKFNGEQIIISDDGQMNDGQHRCWAVAETGKTIQCVIVFGPTRESRFTVDQGVVRTMGHYLAMHGYKDVAALSSVCAWVWQYLQKSQLSRAAKDYGTKTETLMIAEHYKDIPDSLQFVSRVGVGAICSRATLAFCHWAIAKSARSRTLADQFIDSLISGTGLDGGSPILYCRNRLIQMRTGWTPNDRAELIFRSWNAFRRGERTDRIALQGKKLPKLEK